MKSHGRGGLWTAMDAQASAVKEGDPWRGTVTKALAP